MRSPLLLTLLLSLACDGNAWAQSSPATQQDAEATQAEADAEALYGEPSTEAAVDAAADPQTLPTEQAPPSAEQQSSEQLIPEDTRTPAEEDFNALYGVQEYDPLADPTLPAPFLEPSSYDPWEKLNRRVHRFNNAVDRVIAKPLATFYIKVTPRPVRLGVGNFFSNLGQPVSSLNALLQGKPKQAGQSFARFAVNVTLGVGGFFDPATKFRLPNKSEDFGQTLGVWGWQKSRYVELPLFGPRTVRDVFGLVGDGQLSPIRTIDEDKVRIFVQGLQLVDVRTQLMSVDAMREGATDEYALFRDAWMQRRSYQIVGDRRIKGEDDGLPDYLREEEDNPTVPADAMPIIPGSPGG
ncbi:MAG: VacJ family lipoprotein [Lysobacter sp.]|nr:VacJ family lipoprotein [Lysobacter sp.]